jgi:hypothetical protein
MQRSLWNKKVMHDIKRLSQVKISNHDKSYNDLI